MNSRLLWLALIPCLFGLLLLVPRAPTAAQEAPPQRQFVTRGAAPFTDTWARMEARDAQLRRLGRLSPQRPWLRAAPLGRRTPPPPGPDLGSVPELLEAPRAASIHGPSPHNPQQIASGFKALTLADEFSLGGGSIPPDTNGAIGPTQFMEIINDGVAVYSRTGTRQKFVSLNSFFTVVSGGVSFPRNGAFDPRVIFDRRSNRWFAISLEFGQVFAEDNDLILAVSRTSDAAGTFDKYVIPVGVSVTFTDYDTLGTDDNGVYFGFNMFPNVGGAHAKIAATPKASLIAANPSLGPVAAFDDLTAEFTPQPAHNQDAVAANGPAWIVGEDATAFANIVFRKITWNGTTPTLSAPSTVATPVFADCVNAPAQGSNIPINTGDPRLQMAVVRKNRLWTARNVGVNSSGGASNPDRTGFEWYELNVSAATPTLLQRGRVFDPAAANPRFYFYPAIMVSGQGHAAVGFSGCTATEFVGAYTCGRLASDPPNTMQSISQLQAGLGAYQIVDGQGRNRWGDYSYTSLDPSDDMTMWTIQEYAEVPTQSSDIWGTRVTRLLSVPPTLNNPAAQADVGQTGVTIPLTGTGFYDPGPGFPSRLGVAITGGNPNGITGIQATFNSSTSVSVTFNVAANAALGPRNITVTNPDGQTAVAADGLNILTPSDCVIGVTFPNGGETFTTGTTQNVTWTSFMVPGNVNVEYSVDGGVNWFTIAADTANDGSEPWLVPGIPTTEGRVRVSSVDEPSCNDVSDSNFTIARPPCTIGLLSPNGGETWTVGTTQNITWTSANAGPNVLIEVSRDGGTTFSTLAASFPNTGTFTWNVTGPPTTQARARVTSLEDTTCKDASDANFTINQPCSITLTAPNGGETLTAGTVQTITWTSANLPGLVKLEFSNDGGATWGLFLSITTNTGSRTWTVPAIPTTQGRIRAAAADDPTCFDVSDADFTVVVVPPCSIDLTSPDGGEQLLLGSVHNITWTSANAGDAVKIEVSRDSGATWELIATGVQNTGTLPWTVTGPLTQEARIRVSSIAEPTCFDTSAGNFAIVQTTGPVALDSLVVIPRVVTGGTPAVGTVRLTGPAPAGGQVVNLASNNPTKAAVPATVTVPQGAVTADFTITTARVRATRTVTLTAQSQGVTKTAQLRLKRR